MIEKFRKKPSASYILTINAGSSSIKAHLFAASNVKVVSQCSIERIGYTKTVVKKSYIEHVNSNTCLVESLNYHEAINEVTTWIESQTNDSQLLAIGHRIVHGGQNHTTHELITTQVRRDLEEFALFDPEHVPMALHIIDSLHRTFKNVPQIACYDTEFFTTLPRVSQIAPIPRKYEALGVKKFGFHGISYMYLTSTLQRIDPILHQGKVIYAHLGSGASVCAVTNGIPLDTTMSLTPSSGIPMSTRSGDIDPGIYWYLHKKIGMSPQMFNTMMHAESGLLGISESTADMYTLIHNKDSDVRAQEAINVFCYSVIKTIGAYTAVMEGLDGIIFSGGIGEHAPYIRKEICKRLTYMGIQIDDLKNAQNNSIISTETSKIKIRIMHTEEEKVIAKLSKDILTHKK